MLFEKKRFSINPTIIEVLLLFLHRKKTINYSSLNRIISEKYKKRIKCIMQLQTIIFQFSPKIRFQTHR